jgi:hypothetical protein
MGNKELSLYFIKPLPAYPNELVYLKWNTNQPKRFTLALTHKKFLYKNRQETSIQKQNTQVFSHFYLTNNFSKQHCK